MRQCLCLLVHLEKPTREMQLLTMFGVMEHIFHLSSACWHLGRVSSSEEREIVSNDEQTQSNSEPISQNSPPSPSPRWQQLTFLVLQWKVNGWWYPGEEAGVEGRGGLLTDIIRDCAE